MITRITRPQFVRISIVACLAIAAMIAVFQSRSVKHADSLAPLEPKQADALILELARCRTIRSDETVALDDCRRAWDDNREHFFTAAGSGRVPAEPFPGADTAPAKNHDRVAPVDATGEMH
jgi:conjugative transfer region protein TrbK